MNFPDKVKTEDERLSLMDEASKGGTPEDIDKIMALPVDTPDPVVNEEEGVVETPAETPAETPPETPVETPVETPAAAPAETPVEKPPEQDSVSDRNWSITEKDIPKDTYYDMKEGKVRPFITHKDPASLFKTVISEQKRIHYLEDVLMPQEREQAKAEAKAEYERELATLKAEQAKTKGTPAAAPVVPAAPAPDLAESTNVLTKALEELKGIKSEDILENTDKMQSALVAALNQINVLTTNMNEVRQVGKDTSGKVLQFETKQQEDDRLKKQNDDKENKNKQWQTACSLVDSFAATSPDFKADFGTIDQGFGEMTVEAMDFHVKLAGLLFNKHPQAISGDEQKAASIVYLRGDNPALIQKITQYGINEPKNYRVWLELDQIDAVRCGEYRDSVSKEWRPLTDPVTKERVRLGDMQTAYGRYLDMTGKRDKKTKELLKTEADNITNAIGKRDNGLVSMDTNQLRSDGTGSNLTEQQANDILEQIDPQGATTIYMRSGNKEPLEKLNQALIRLGQEPLAIPELESSVRPVKK